MPILDIEIVARPQEDLVPGLAGRLAREIGLACGRSPDHVHILYEPPAAGRIAFGGRLLRKASREGEGADRPAPEEVE